MKKLVVLLLVVTGFAFLGEPTARAGVGFVFGLPIPVPVFFGPGYYGPGPLLRRTLLRIRGYMGTDRIGATDITAVTMVADTTAAAIMVVATIEGVTMADVPTTIIIGTIDPSLISER